ncbi:diguanylate cyclase [Vibrio navarrensis]|uniref:sensor domain-containing diguanylate cyclase n=1 Tax=Vibrio navarrensis TaxID=29495 RepID=UPI001869F788|nr:sensor domain-containing diguanylate cyclase [Vibrio navarrensis]MBE4585635.1 diguanylate cyclase [Vibrio navarrensis]MBE4601771.1 diguanylate cyclase [Vibrio navarrensis]
MEEYLLKIKQLEKELQQLKQENARLQEKLHVALDGTGLCLWEQHVPTGTLTIFNMEWGKMLGYQSHELTATVETWKSKLHPDDYDLAVGAFEDHLAGKTDLYQVVHRMVHKDGSDNWVSDRGRVVEYDAGGAPLRMMGTHIDITQEKRYEQQLAKLADSDPLTGLLNRSALEKQFYAETSVSSDQRWALIFIDVDNFKSVNDELGHKTGDSVLIAVAQYLKQVTQTNSQIGRLGGDEFVILCQYVERSEIMHICDQLLSRLSKPFEFAPKVSIGLSIGVCLFQGAGQPFDDIYEKADAAMYRVKKSGKNSVAFVDIND